VVRTPGWLTGDHLVGLHAGELAIPRGPLVYLLLSHPKLEVGLRQVERFSTLAIDTLRIALNWHARSVGVVVDVGNELAATRQMPDYAISVVANIFRRVVGVGDLLQEAQRARTPRACRSRTAPRAVGDRRLAGEELLPSMLFDDPPVVRSRSCRVTTPE
jgi:hypothetical protein